MSNFWLNYEPSALGLQEYNFPDGPLVFKCMSAVENIRYPIKSLCVFCADISYQRFCILLFLWVTIIRFIGKVNIMIDRSFNIWTLIWYFESERETLLWRFSPYYVKQKKLMRVLDNIKRNTFRITIILYIKPIWNQPLDKVCGSE